MDMNNKTKILVLAPHTDDGEIGCGGTIVRFLEEGKQVKYMAFSTCEDSIPEEFPKDILETEVVNATTVLGIEKENLHVKNYPVRRFSEHRQDILEDLVKMQKNYTPDLVFMPSSFDVHQDHKVIFEEGRRAFKRQSLLGYEFMWNNFSFDSSTLFRLEERHVEKKIKAISHYKSQNQRFYAIDKFIIGQSNFRGLQIFTEFAEAFETIRWIF